MVDFSKFGNCWNKSKYKSKIWILYNFSINYAIRFIINCIHFFFFYETWRWEKRSVYTLLETLKGMRLLKKARESRQLCNYQLLNNVVHLKHPLPLYTPKKQKFLLHKTSFALYIYIYTRGEKNTLWMYEPFNFIRKAFLQFIQITWEKRAVKGGKKKQRDLARLGLASKLVIAASVT